MWWHFVQLILQTGWYGAQSLAFMLAFIFPLLSCKKFSIKHFHLMLQTLNLRGGIDVASFSIQPSPQLLATSVHVCNKDRTRNRKKGFWGHLILSLEVTFVSNTAYFADVCIFFLQFCTFLPGLCLSQPSCVSKLIPLCIFMCFWASVNHSSTGIRVQFLIGPPGFHSSSLLIFSCFPFCTPRGWNVSIGLGQWKRVWAIAKQIEDEGMRKDSRGRKMKGDNVEKKKEEYEGGAPWSQRPLLTPDLDHDLKGYPRGQRLCESATATIHSTVVWWWSYAASPACLTWSVLLYAYGSQGPHIHL